MSTAAASGGRMRAYMEFLAAVFYFFLARALAHRGAQGFSSDRWSPLVEQAMLAFLMLIGYAAMGFWLDHEEHPISAQGWPRRKGWPGEAGLGLATVRAQSQAMTMTITRGTAIVTGAAAGADLVRYSDTAAVRLADREDWLRAADRADLQSGAA